MLLYIRVTELPFFARFVKGFPAILGCSDFVYGEIFSIPTEPISNSVSKFLLEKNEVSNFTVLGCNAGSSHQLKQWNAKNLFITYYRICWMFFCCCRRGYICYWLIGWISNPGKRLIGGWYDGRFIFFTCFCIFFHVFFAYFFPPAYS